MVCSSYKCYFFFSFFWYFSRSSIRCMPSGFYFIFVFFSFSLKYIFKSLIKDVYVCIIIGDFRLYFPTFRWQFVQWPFHHEFNLPMHTNHHHIQLHQSVFNVVRSISIGKLASNDFNFEFDRRRWEKKNTLNRLWNVTRDWNRFGFDCVRLSYVFPIDLLSTPSISHCSLGWFDVGQRLDEFRIE